MRLCERAASPSPAPVQIEKEARFGAMTTDFTMVRGGALHRANGGYLILGGGPGPPIARHDRSGEPKRRGPVHRRSEREDRGVFRGLQAQRLTGEQGVIIPQGNMRHLMLRHEVTDAVRNGLFHIYPVTTIDEILTIVTGIPAGEPGGDGLYPEGSLNHSVARRIREMAERLRRFAAHEAAQAGVPLAIREEH